MRTAIVGGGAAGFFLAINLKEMCPQMDVTIFERSQHVLRKVKVSGGGRCNCTNTFEDVSDLSQVYPRGHRLMKRLMKASTNAMPMSGSRAMACRLWCRMIIVCFQLLRTRRPSSAVSSPIADGLALR